MDFSLPLPIVHLGTEAKLHVRIVKTALIAPGKIVRFNQMYIQIRFIVVVSQAQVKSTEVFTCPLIVQKYYNVLSLRLNRAAKYQVFCYVPAGAKKNRTISPLIKIRL